MDLQRVQESAAKAANVVVLTGAGVSAESGVPTFRSGADTVVWKGLDAAELSSSRMVADNLPLVWEWFEYRRELISACKPNAAHFSIAEWQQRFPKLTLVTQNVDGLHAKAGSQDVLELHGNLWRGRCLACGERAMLQQTPLDEIPPRCPGCASPMRPDVVLFGELLPIGVFERAADACRQADLCFVVGTSSVVYPAAELPQISGRAGALVVEVNPEPSGICGRDGVELAGKAGDILPLI